MFSKVSMPVGDLLSLKNTHKLRVKGWKKTFQANDSQKNGGVAVLISDKIEFTLRIVK